MSYSTTGPKPFERASKSSHHHIINDPDVVATLKNLYVPPKSSVADLSSLLHVFSPKDSQIEHIVAIDGGYTEVGIRESFPSATIHFFQFGALHFRREHLAALAKSQHVAPEDIQKLKNIDRLKLPLATKGARAKNLLSLKDTVRAEVHAFLGRQTLGEQSSLLDTLAWFLFNQYVGPQRTTEDKTWTLSSNPYEGAGPVTMVEAEMSSNHTFTCAHTNKPVYLADVFRLHERIEEETGAAGIAGYLAGAIEHLILLHIIKNLLQKNPDALKSVLFIMDRPTGWFGLTAPMHKPMLRLIDWLHSRHDFYLAGLEKSGAFVDHAHEIKGNMKAGTFLLLSDDYIYRFISPGEEDPVRPYASTSYYGHKVIFKSRYGHIHVVSIPVRVLKKSPTVADLPNLLEILTHVEELHCDMYENALLPIALANKLVSLSAHPSSQILKTFAQTTVGH